jgi:hypothetical protein
MGRLVYDGSGRMRERHPGEKKPHSSTAVVVLFIGGIICLFCLTLVLWVRERHDDRRKGTTGVSR